MTLGYPISGMIWDKKAKLTGSQSAKGDRVADVSYAVYQLLIYLFILLLFQCFDTVGWASGMACS